MAAAGSHKGASAALVSNTARLLGLAVPAAQSPLARTAAVRDAFPKLAYCCSDVVILVGTEPLFSTRYLERAVAFAKRANSGVQDVDLPVLVLVSNKRTADECDLDIQRTTEAFTQHMGPDMALLDSYFTCVICCQMPNRRGVVTDDDGVQHDGAALFSAQIGKLKLLLTSLMRSRQMHRDSAQGSRLITSRHGLWFTLLPKVRWVCSCKGAVVLSVPQRLPGCLKNECSCVFITGPATRERW
jgi:hypothetical protein